MHPGAGLQVDDMPVLGSMHHELQTQWNSIGCQKECVKYDKIRSITLPRFLSLYTQETITTIVHKSKILHVAFVDEDGVPHCVPRIGALEDNDAGDLGFYMVSHPSSRLLPMTEVVSCPSGYLSSHIYNCLSQHNIHLVATGTILDGYVRVLSNFSTHI